jgi:hypothetical protein
MPAGHFDLLLRRCLPWLPTYKILGRGIVRNHGENDDVTAEISCDLEEAEQLVELAKQIYPPAASPIEESVRRGRKREPVLAKG